MILGVSCEAMAVLGTICCPPLLEDVIVFCIMAFTGSVAFTGPRGKHPLEALSLSACVVFSFRCLVKTDCIVDALNNELFFTDRGTFKLVSSLAC